MSSLVGEKIEEEIMTTVTTSEEKPEVTVEKQEVDVEESKQEEEVSTQEKEDENVKQPSDEITTVKESEIVEASNVESNDSIKSNVVDQTNLEHSTKVEITTLIDESDQKVGDVPTSTESKDDHVEIPDSTTTHATTQIKAEVDEIKPEGSDVKPTATMTSSSDNGGFETVNIIVPFGSSAADLDDDLEGEHGEVDPNLIMPSITDTNPDIVSISGPFKSISSLNTEVRLGTGEDGKEDIKMIQDANEGSDDLEKEMEKLFEKRGYGDEDEEDFKSAESDDENGNSLGFSGSRVTNGTGGFKGATSHVKNRLSHKDCLKLICRICGTFNVKTKQVMSDDEEDGNYEVGDASNFERVVGLRWILSTLHDINVLTESDQIFPKHVCKACFEKFQVSVETDSLYQKTELANIKSISDPSRLLELARKNPIVDFWAHSSLDCQICAESQFQKLGDECKRRVREEMFVGEENVNLNTIVSRLPSATRRSFINSYGQQHRGALMNGMGRRGDNANPFGDDSTFDDEGLDDDEDELGAPAAPIVSRLEGLSLLEIEITEEEREQSDYDVPGDDGEHKAMVIAQVLCCLKKTDPDTLRVLHDIFRISIDMSRIEESTDPFIINDYNRCVEILDQIEDDDAKAVILCRAMLIQIIDNSERDLTRAGVDVSYISGEMVNVAKARLRKMENEGSSSISTSIQQLKTYNGGSYMSMQSVCGNGRRVGGGASGMRGLGVGSGGGLDGLEGRRSKRNAEDLIRLSADDLTEMKRQIQADLKAVGRIIKIDVIRHILDAEPDRRILLDKVGISYDPVRGSYLCENGLDYNLFNEVMLKVERLVDIQWAVIMAEAIFKLIEVQDTLSLEHAGINIDSSNPKTPLFYRISCEIRKFISKFAHDVTHCPQLAPYVVEKFELEMSPPHFRAVDAAIKCGLEKAEYFIRVGRFNLPQQASAYKEKELKLPGQPTRVYPQNHYDNTVDEERSHLQTLSQAKQDWLKQQRAKKVADKNIQHQKKVDPITGRVKRGRGRPRVYPRREDLEAIEAAEETDKALLEDAIHIKLKDAPSFKKRTTVSEQMTIPNTIPIVDESVSSIHRKYTIIPHDGAGVGGLPTSGSHHLHPGGHLMDAANGEENINVLLEAASNATPLTASSSSRRPQHHMNMESIVPDEFLDDAITGSQNEEGDEGDGIEQPEMEVVEESQTVYVADEEDEFGEGEENTTTGTLTGRVNFHMKSPIHASPPSVVCRPEVVSPTPTKVDTAMVDVVAINSKDTEQVMSPNPVHTESVPEQVEVEGEAAWKPDVGKIDVEESVVPEVEPVVMDDSKLEEVVCTEHREEQTTNVTEDVQPEMPMKKEVPITVCSSPRKRKVPVLEVPEAEVQTDEVITTTAEDTDSPDIENTTVSSPKAKRFASSPTRSSARIRKAAS